MGKPRHGVAGNNSNQDDAQQQQQRLLELVLASLCVAVESQASEQQPTAADSLVVVYREMMWKLPIEHALQVVNAWSLNKFHTTKPAFQREIVYPADAKPAPGEELQQQQQQEEKSDAREQQKKAKKKSKKRLRARTSDDVPEFFKVGRIEEDPLEARWDHQGTPVPLRRNILGEHYAPRSDPLQFLKAATSHSPSEIYQQLKRAVREDLATRERRRIQTLNDREKLRKQQAGELSPEAALEAKFDRMFVERAEPQESFALTTKGGERATRALCDGNGGEGLGAGEDGSGDDDTDEISDRENNQQTPALRVK